MAQGTRPRPVGLSVSVSSGTTATSAPAAHHVNDTESTLNYSITKLVTHHGLLAPSVIGCRPGKEMQRKTAEPRTGCYGTSLPARIVVSEGYPHGCMPHAGSATPADACAERVQQPTHTHTHLCTRHICCRGRMRRPYARTHVAAVRCVLRPPLGPSSGCAGTTTRPKRGGEASCSSRQDWCVRC